MTLTELTTNLKIGDKGHVEMHKAERARLNVLSRCAGDVSGLVGDGVTDNTAALQALIDARPALTLPPGDFLLNGTVRIAKPFVLAGAGNQATRLLYRGAAWALVLGSESATPARYPHLRDIGILGHTGAAGGVKVCGASHFTLARVQVRNFPAGVGIGLMNWVWGGAIEDCITNECQAGLRATAVGGTNAFNAVRLVGGQYGQGCAYGVVVGDPLVDATPHTWHTGHKSLISAVAFEDATQVGLWLVDGEAMTVSDCYFEGNEVTHLRIGRTGHTPVPRTPIIAGNRFGPVCPLGVDVQEANGVIVRENTICHRSVVGEGVGIRIAVGVTSPLLRDNFFEDIQTPYDLPVGMPVPTVY